MSGQRTHVRKGLPVNHRRSQTLPADIPVYHTEYEGIIKLILEKAKSLAKDEPIDTEVSVDAEALFGDLPADLPALIAPVMYRADEYGLLPGRFELGTFYFVKRSTM